MKNTFCKVKLKCFLKKQPRLAITVAYIIKQFIDSELLKGCLKNKVETVCAMLPGGVCAKGCSIFSFFKSTLT